MIHIAITQPGSFLGITGNRLVVNNNKTVIREIPLGKIKSVLIESNGITFSSAFAMQCSLRGIPVFIINYKGEAVSALYGQYHHATARLREYQFSYLKSENALKLARDVIITKIKNQRSMLLYAGKYLTKKDLINEVVIIRFACDSMREIVQKLKEIDMPMKKEYLLGQEGYAARIYWNALRASYLLPESFQKREGRGSKEIINQMLNYGYAVLNGYVWKSLQNAGLELFAGFLHEPRPGKPSLVLDVMEIYRSWVVDRMVIKHAGQFYEMDVKCKRTLIQSIHTTFQRQYRYRGKHVKLEAILQRQMYRLAGSFAGERKYNPYLFRW